MDNLAERKGKKNYQTPSMEDQTHLTWDKKEKKRKEGKKKKEKRKKKKKWTKKKKEEEEKITA